MNEAMEVYEGVGGDIQVSRPPEVVLEEARKAAAVLHDVLQKKEKKVMMNGEQYLEFEDWQTVARFYGLTAKVKETEFIDYGGVKGFLAKAVVVRSDGMEISAAEAMCMNDEDKWSTRTKYEYVNGQRTKTGEVPVPLFQLRSMAQTRACAKALRNVLAWVVVLAGYKPTPAEELTGDEGNNGKDKKPPLTQPGKKSDKPAETLTGEKITIMVEDVRKVTGTNQKTGKVWTKFVVKANEKEYGTFSETFAQVAKDSMQSAVPVEITFTTNKFGNDISAIQIVEPPKEEERNPGEGDE